MNEKQPDSVMEFPCQFPIKALGKTSPQLDMLVIEIVRRHVEDIHEDAVTIRPSKGGKYTSVTVTIEASSKQQLDAIYYDLTACPEIIMAL